MYSFWMSRYITFSVLLGVCSVGWGAVTDCVEGSDTFLEYGDAVSCTFDATGDVDVFRFFGNAGDQPFIQLGSALCGQELYLYDDQGQLLRSASGCFAVSITDYALPDDGIYTLLATLTTSASSPASYTLELPCVFGECTVNPPPAGADLLGYVPVSPCRIVDTRFTLEGALAAGETRHFYSHGDVLDQNQAAGRPPANQPQECPFDGGEPEAVHLNVTVIPRGTLGEPGGWATLWPWGEDRPVASWINYAAGGPSVANAGTLQATVSSESDPDFSVSVSRAAHLVIDVLGYYTK